MKRLVSLLIVFLLTLIFSLGFGVTRFFLPGSLTCASRSVAALSDISVAHHRRPELPTRASFLFVVEEERGAKIAPPDMQPLACSPCLYSSIHTQLFARQDNCAHTQASLALKLAKSSPEPLFVQHCLLLI